MSINCEDPIHRAEVIRLINLCERYELSGLDFIRRFPLEQLVPDYNGLGPEWFPEKFRKALDGINKPLLPMVLIHDVRFAHSDGSVEQFIAANDELRANGHAIVDKHYPRWRFVTRWWMHRKVELFYRLCRDFGWKAYIAAYIASQQDKE